MSPMPPLDRYLKEVRTFLPSAQADDIVNELSENLRAQIEDRETELGRDLTDTEQEALLNEHGKPILVAARYRPEQSLSFGRQLIGPALFPSYVRVLSINLAITVVVVIVAAIGLATGQPFGSALSGVALAILIQFGIVTGIFIAADRAITGDATWPADVVRSLPSELQRSFPDRVGEQFIGKDHSLTVPRRTSVFDLAVSAITIGWLVVVRPPNVTEVLRSGPGWESFFLPVVLVMSIAAVQPVINFFRPQWVDFRSTVRIATDLALIVIFALSLNTGRWIVPTDTAGAAEAKARALADAINPWVGVSLTVALVITAGMLLLEVRRLAVRRRSQRERGTPSEAG